jgi:hypothetical protein
MSTKMVEQPGDVQGRSLAGRQRIALSPLQSPLPPPWQLRNFFFGPMRASQVYRSAELLISLSIPISEGQSCVASSFLRFHLQLEVRYRPSQHDASSMPIFNCRSPLVTQLLILRTTKLCKANCAMIPIVYQRR